MTGEQEEGITAAAATSGGHHIGSPDPGDMLPDGHQAHRPREDGRRILLVIYIHGYMGKDSSFRSFPAHVHDLLKLSLGSHAIHTKIYPRYKTYRYIDVAAENFSRWLEPHESPDTDIVLVGHSMGGLLAADVVLLRPREGVAPAHPGNPFRHRILGIIALDSPFLGLHPGIIAAGIASLFRSKAQPPKEEDGASLSPTSPHSPRFPPLSPSPDPAGRLSTDVYSDLAAAAARGSLDLSRGSLDISPLGSPDGSSAALSYFPSASSVGQQQNGAAPDPHYNPPFWNDVMFKDRGWMRNMWHFAKKRKIEGSSLIEAATNHLVCHMQYGKSLTDFRGLHERYESVRRLEDVDEIGDQPQPQSQGGRGRDKARVRFVNYFTISTGRIKTPDRGRSPARLDTSGAGVPGSVVGGSGIATRSPSASIGPSSPLREVSPRPMSESHPASPSLPRRPSGLYLHPDDGRGDGTDTPRISIEDHSNLGRPKLVELVGPISEQKHNEEKESAPAPAPAVAATSFTTDAKEPEPETETKDDAAVEGDDGGISTATEGLNKLELGLESGLDPIPERPEEPQPPVLAADASSEERKKADKEHMRARKAYLEAIKTREKAIKERQKVVEKRRAKMEKEEAKKDKEEKKRQQTEEKRREKEEQKQEKERRKREKDEAKRLADEEKRMEEEAKRLAQGTQGTQGQQQQSEEDRTDPVEGSGSGSGSSDSVDRQADLAKQDTALRQAVEGVVTGSSAAAAPSGQVEQEQAEDAKPAEEGPKKSKKPRKFCTLPKKPAGGGRDSQWVEVFMEGVDEIGAHTGLFLPGPHYERLVGDVGMRIVGWVQDDATKRAILEAS